MNPARDGKQHFRSLEEHENSSEDSRRMDNRPNYADPLLYKAQHSMCGNGVCDEQSVFKTNVNNVPSDCHPFEGANVISPSRNGSHIAPENNSIESKNSINYVADDIFGKKRERSMLLSDDKKSKTYKRRVYDASNEGELGLKSSQMTSGESISHFQNTQEGINVTISPIDNYEDKLPLDGKMTPTKVCRKYSPCPENDKLKFVGELYNFNDRLEPKLMDEMFETVQHTVKFRQFLFSLLDTTKSDRIKFQMDTESLNNISALSLLVKKSITNVNNDLIALNFMKCLLNSNANMNNTYRNEETASDSVSDRKKSKKLQRQESYTIELPTLNTRDSIEENTPASNSARSLTYDPSNTLFNALKCVEGQCSTTREMFEHNFTTDCNSTNGCYLWADLNGNKCSEDLYAGKIGCWTYDQDLTYNVLHQNKKHQFDSMFDFISDVCNVAVAEIRIPKPDWNEYCEFNCLSGYCCSKCCTCKSPTKLLKMSNRYKSFASDDLYLNFNMETTLGRLDLHKRVLGSCFCYCRCNTDNSTLFERILSDFSPYETANDAISWYDVDSNNSNPESDDVNKNIVQERFIIRVRSDSLPSSLKFRLPFTCKLKLKTGNSELGTIDLDECISNPSDDSDMDVIPNTPSSQSTVLDNADYNPCENVEMNDVNLNNSPNAKATGTIGKVRLKDFKYLNDFTFWDALEILSKEQSMLHAALCEIKDVDIACFDPLEIDISDMNVESLNIQSDSLVMDSKRDNYVEIALYLPYVPGNVLPWEFESIDLYDILVKKHNIDTENAKGDSVKENKIGITPAVLLRSYYIVPLKVKYVFEFMRIWILMRNDLFNSERALFKVYKKHWHKHLKKFTDNNGIDLFYWGILPVRAMDHPNMFVPLPAGYKQNDINFPYLINDVPSPHECKGFGIADLNPKRESFSQLKLISERHSSLERNYGNISNRSKRDSFSSSRRKAIEIETNQSKSVDSGTARQTNWLMPSYSNLTGPSIRWTYSCMDTVNEPLHCIADFGELPIYRLLKCPELNTYTLDRMIRFDRNTAISPDKLLDEELHYRLTGVWTRNECRIFVEKYLMYPKNFSKISQYLDSKKCSDCVDFYYRFKYRLKLKQRLRELKIRNKNKCDMSRHLKREGFVLSSLDSVLDDCYTDGVKDFNARNKLCFNTISDYLLRSGSLDSSQSYEVQFTQHRDDHTTPDDEFQYTLDNIAEGYFLPKKYLSLVMRKRLEYPLSVADDEHTALQRGCFLLDYDNNSMLLQKSMIVALNTEYLLHLRQKTGKRCLGTSIIDKLIYKYECDGMKEDENIMYDKDDSYFRKSLEKYNLDLMRMQISHEPYIPEVVDLANVAYKSRKINDHEQYLPEDGTDRGDSVDMKDTNSRRIYNSSQYSDYQYGLDYGL